MLRWTITFLVIALLAAIFGFGGIAAGAASIAKIIFIVFLVLFLFLRNSFRTLTAFGTVSAEYHHVCKMVFHDGAFK